MNENNNTEHENALISEQEGPIIILPDDDSPESEPPAESGASLISARLAGSGYDASAQPKAAPVKMTFGRKIANFFYHHWLFLAFGLVLAGVFALIVSVSARPPYDVIISAFTSELKIDAFTQKPLEEAFAQYCEDSDGVGGVRTAVHGYNLLDDVDFTVSIKTEGFFEEDIKRDHTCFVYLMDEANYAAFVADGHEGLLESYNGCPLWIELGGTSFAQQFDKEEVDLDGIGICLLALSEEAAQDEDAAARYAAARTMLGNMQAQHPDVFKAAE